MTTVITLATWYVEGEQFMRKNNKLWSGVVQSEPKSTGRQ